MWNACLVNEDEAMGGQGGWPAGISTWTKPDGSQVFFVSDRELEEPHIFRWSPGNNKVERRAEAGLLQPLPIPEKSWVLVSMDFISGFPEVKGFDGVMVIVDRFSKYEIFRPTPKNCSAERNSSGSLNNALTASLSAVT